MKKIQKLLLVLMTAMTLSFLGLCFQKPTSICASTASGKHIVVSLGDSYASGEGIEPFYGQDKISSLKIQDEDWLAHRSQKAWSGQLIINGQKMIRDDNWFFVAASGAEIRHLTEGHLKKYDYDDLKGSKYLTPQFDIFDTVNKKYGSGVIDFVTVTIGGNDIGFTDFMTSAITAQDKIDENIEGVKYAFNNTHETDQDGKKITVQPIKTSLKEAYKAIAEKAGKQATIIVAGYPHLMNPEGFQVLFFSVTSESAQKVNNAVDYLNGEIEKVVNECHSEGMNIYFVSPSEAFAGHEAYTSQEYINSVVLGTNSQDLNQNGLISSYSLHPNELGAAAYAKVVQQEINKHLGTSNTKPSLKLKASKGTIKLSWTAVDGATKYRVYQYIDGKAKLIKKTSKTSLKIKNTVAGTKYTYAVRAYVNGKWTKVKSSDKKTIKAK